ESSSPGFTFLRPSALAQSPQFWILPQPNYSNPRKNLVWFNLQLTAQYLLCQMSKPCSSSTNCSPKTHQKYSPSSWTIHLFCSVCSVLPGSVSFLHANFYSSKLAVPPVPVPVQLTLPVKLVKRFSCLLSVILHVGQISEENYDTFHVRNNFICQ
ncbi:hypothetical protein XENOCAPTIV_012833, partial [Xenoophorus captivus]